MLRRLSFLRESNPLQGDKRRIVLEIFEIENSLDLF